MPLNVTIPHCGHENSGPQWGDLAMPGSSVDSVNLDALIAREYFETNSGGKPIAAAAVWKEVGINTLTLDDRLVVLRKPIFQRETSAWRPETIATFIRSVVENNVVPAIILWRSSKSGFTFIIDGAHRLSALAAWVNDDYGDGKISQAFYGDAISTQQDKLAKETRAIVEEDVGSYEKLKRYAKFPEEAPTTALRTRATSIYQAITVQPVEGDAVAAEQSYIRINSTAVPISKAELTLIQSRTLPAGIATRALLHAGEGFEYWRHFEEPIRKQIEEEAGIIYNQLIEPINDYPARALDLPAPKRGYSANSMQTILDLVTILNRNPNISRPATAVPDTDGTKTVQHLERVRKATECVFGNKHSGSLALHPALYCYDSRGRFIGKAFIGAIEFVRYLEQTNKVFSFTKHRKGFEEFLIGHPQLMNQIGETQGSGGGRGVPAVVELYKQLLKGLEDAKGTLEIIADIQANSGLKFLDWSPPADGGGRRFTETATAMAVIKVALEKDICPECGGRFYIKDRSRDHKIRLEDGGTGAPSNLELKHPYCNSGYKERLVHLAKEAALVKEAVNAQT
jgi:Protein of unknown function DUF262/HNH endonuclease